MVPEEIDRSGFKIGGFAAAGNPQVGPLCLSTASCSPTARALSSSLAATSASWHHGDMAIQIESEGPDQYEDDLEVVLRLQGILLQAAEGQRGPELDKEYRGLRKALLADPSYEMVIPKFIRRHRDLEGLWPTFKSFSPQWEPRRQEVREQFEPLLAEAESVTVSERLAASDHADAEVVRKPGYDASTWTGASGPAERVLAVKTLMPVAQNAVEQLMILLATPGHNGGPPLDEVEEALDELRQLHAALGVLLAAADDGRLTEAFNDGLATDAARYAKRAARALRDDPVPYAIAATILATLTACGLPGIGGFLSGVAIQMKKR